MILQAFEVVAAWSAVSMKSGLGDRNNDLAVEKIVEAYDVSMKSGLGDRNNLAGADLALEFGQRSQ